MKIFVVVCKGQNVRRTEICVAAHESETQNTSCYSQREVNYTPGAV